MGELSIYEVHVSKAVICFNHYYFPMDIYPIVRLPSSTLTVKATEIAEIPRKSLTTWDLTLFSVCAEQYHRRKLFQQVIWSVWNLEWKFDKIPKTQCLNYRTPYGDSAFAFERIFMTSDKLEVWEITSKSFHRCSSIIQCFVVTELHLFTYGLS